MKRRWFPGKRGWTWLVATAVLATWSASWAVGAEAGAADADKPGAKKARKTTSRLPMYYAQIGLSDQQRGDVLKTLDEYVAKLAELRAQLEAMTKERDEKVQAVLTAAQLAKLEQLKAAAKNRRQSGKTANEEAPKEPAATKRDK